jgi:hypothetical protein
MRTRRGVERHPTGDSDVLSEMMYQSASIREPRRRSTKVHAEAEEEGTAKTQQESCDEEEVVAAVPAISEEETTTKKDGPIRTRRGVQRKSTGDSEQLGLMLYGLAKGASRRESSSDVDGGGVPTEISLSLTSDTPTAAEPRRRGRRKSTVNVDDSENVEDSTNNDAH